MMIENISTSDAGAMLQQLAEPIQQFVNVSIAALHQEKQVLVGAALAKGARLRVEIDLPQFHVTLVLTDGERSDRLAELKPQPN